jgi:Coenzyme PQQ synthesis protein D (PqqD)
MATVESGAYPEAYGYDCLPRVGDASMKRSLFVARSKAIAARGLGEETMVMSATDSTLFTLNEVASVIWKAIDGTTPLREIVRHEVCTKYDVVLDVALEGAEGAVRKLAQHGILILSEKPIFEIAPPRIESSLTVDAENASENPSSQPETPKKQYTAPSFEFETAFEVSALACGKVFANESGCHFNRKVS